MVARHIPFRRVGYRISVSVRGAAPVQVAPPQESISVAGHPWEIFPGGSGQLAPAAFEGYGTPQVYSGFRYANMVGSLPQLGSWDPNAAVALSPAAYPVWSGSVQLPADTAFEYKCVAKGAAGHVTWEGGANRSHTTGASGTAAPLPGLTARPDPRGGMFRMRDGVPVCRAVRLPGGARGAVRRRRRPWPAPPTGRRVWAGSRRRPPRTRAPRGRARCRWR
ncbi:hypothetical protein HUT16_32905 [Kitasatospora sp. NA04385]|nr:hypothetical protein HUT16_32905 [Kitasatospora sp. NA04385]